jgi:hypothetical protein
MKSKVISAVLALVLVSRGYAPAADVATGAKAQPIVQDNVVVDAETEKIIKSALKYLAAKQTPNGSWNAGAGEHPVAMTAYTLMAFLAAGNTPNDPFDRELPERSGRVALCPAKKRRRFVSDGLAGGRAARGEEQRH